MPRYTSGGLDAGKPHIRICEAGGIVGDFRDSMGNDHGFLDTAGSFTQIDVPGATATSANGINDADQIVGGLMAPRYTVFSKLLGMSLKLMRRRPRSLYGALWHQQRRPDRREYYAWSR